MGVDTHEGHAAASVSVDLGPRDTLTPEVRYVFTHYENALLDLDLHRGPADVHEVSLTSAWSHEVARGFLGTATAGLSVGSPMPVLASRRAVVAPSLGLGLRWTGRRSRVTVRYTYAYTSLGPRIGYGQQHGARLRIDLHPREGSRYRDLALRGTLRFAHGGAPLAADPDVKIPGLPPPRATTGTLTTTTLAAGLRVDVPVLRGPRLHLRRGSDLRPRGDRSGAAGRRRPDADHGEAHLRAGRDDLHRQAPDRDPRSRGGAGGGSAPASSGERREDRTRTSDERAIEEAIERDP